MCSTIEQILEYLVERPGAVAMLKSTGVYVLVNGKVHRLSKGAPVDLVVKDAVNMNMVTGEILRENGLGACDKSYKWKRNDDEHWRVQNRFEKVNGKVTNQIRIFPAHPPLASELGLSGLITDDLIYEGGIVVVCGDRGSGRMTALYSMLMEVLDGHFAITIEDPVIYEPHVPDNAVLNRREIGMVGDVPSFAEGLRQAALQKPHIVMLGKVPDGETARLMVEVACGGSVVMINQFGNSPEDAMSRLVAREEETVARNLAHRFAESMLNIVKLVVFMKCNRYDAYTSRDVINGDRLEALKDLFREGKKGTRKKLKKVK
jgi:Tfp pilus assembly pilus retraction ATPase PilT